MRKGLLAVTALAALFCVSEAVAQRAYNRFDFYGGYSYARANIFPGDEIDTTTGTPPTTFATGAGTFHNLHGFEVAATYNVSRFFAAKVDFSARYGQTQHNTLPGGTFTESNGITQLVLPGVSNVNISQRDYSGMCGVQFKDNASRARLKYFAHALFGVAPQRTHFSNIDLVHERILGGNTITSDSFTMAAGGGVDWRYSRQLDIRILQFDYNPVFANGQTLVSVGQTIDTTITNLATGSAFVKSNQAYTVPARRQDNYRISFGIVIHR